MNLKEQLITTYEGFEKQGHAIFAVTLSTFVKSKKIAESPRMQHLWDQHFIRRVRRRIPEYLPLHHDFIIELSPPQRVLDSIDSQGIPTYRTECYYHYHGLVAVKAEHSHRIWKDGRLNPALDGSLRSFQSAGKYRPFKIPSFDFAPVRKVEAWGTYMFKDQNTAFSFS